MLLRQWVFSSELPKVHIAMVDVQRLSLGEGVEPQANGGRKITGKGGENRNEKARFNAYAFRYVNRCGFG